MAYYIPACLYHIVSLQTLQETVICWLIGLGRIRIQWSRGRVNGLYRVGEVGCYDGLIVAAGKSETCYSTTERTHIHGYMDLQALRMRWK